MYRNLLLYVILFSLFAQSCSTDDEVAVISETEQATQDDTAIVNYLAKYYFQANTGKVKAFDSTITTDDNYTPLSQIAVKLPSGVWYAQNPEVTANGVSVSSSYDKKLLMNYDMYIFISSKNDDGTISYGSPNSPYISTLTSGTAKWDNNFYLHTLSATEVTNGVTESYYEMPGLQEGLKYFKTTERTVSDIPIFQGVIVVPSRLVYGRNSNYLGFNSTTTYVANPCVIFNFEILNQQ